VPVCLQQHDVREAHARSLADAALWLSRSRRCGSPSGRRAAAFPGRVVFRTGAGHEPG
jgi:hypothetical protein